MTNSTIPRITFKINSDNKQIVNDIKHRMGMNAMVGHIRGLDGDSITQIIIAVSNSAVLVAVIAVIRDYIKSKSVEIESDVDIGDVHFKARVKGSNIKQVVSALEKAMPILKKLQLVDKVDADEK